MTVRRRPDLEPLESREAPYGSWGGSVVTYSFVPDGTRWSGGTSALVSTLDRVKPGWRDAIRRALRDWSLASGLTFDEVADQGQPIGVLGKSQGDARFGDIRIGAVLSPSSPKTLAWTYEPPPSGTIAGDVTFNLSQDWSSSGVDLYSVALHELGHAVGGLSHSGDPDSVMSATYKGKLSGLGPSDVAAVQVVYGDAYSPSQVFNKIGRSA